MRLQKRLQHRCFHVNIEKKNLNLFFTEQLHWLRLLFYKIRKFPSKTSVAETQHIYLFNKND